MFLSKKRLPLWRGLSAVFAAFLFIFSIGSIVAEEQKMYVDQALGTISSSVVTEKTEGEDLYKYKSDYATTQGLVDADKELGRKIAAEGAVLLKNEDKSLPLSNVENKVTLVGMTAYKNQLGGKMGSGASNNSALGYPQVTLEMALAEQNITINPDMKDAYGKVATITKGETVIGFRELANISGSFGMTEVEAPYNVNEVKQSELETAKSGITTASFGDYSTAIVVIGRVSSEGRDYIPGTKGVTDEGALSALGLTNDERAMVTMAEGKADKVIVLINSNSPMEIEELKNDEGVDAILWIGTPGVWGMNGVVDVLTGKANPSGHLPDTYAVNASISPAAINTGVFVWKNKEDISIADGTYMGVNYSAGKGKYDNIRATAFEVQAENIYVGYKYYETRYADTVLNPASGASGTQGTVSGATKWNYEDEVSYGFGYGSSYTSFEQTLKSLNVDKSKKQVTATIDVKNTGAMDGKDAVQLYVSLPYKQYDIDNKVEKAAIQLLDYEKTPLIKANETKTITITADMKYMASYDENKAETYILGDGDYYFSIGNGAHDALNNTLAKQGKKVADGMTYDGNAANSMVWNNRGVDTNTFSTAQSGYKIENQLEDSDLNFYKPGSVTYLSRSNWTDTWPKVYNDVTVNEAMIKMLRNRTYEISTDDNVTDQFGVDYGTEKITLGAMRGASFDDERWFLFLNQITREEAVEVIEKGGNGTPTLESIQNPFAIQADGPNGYNSSGRNIGSHTNPDETESPHYVAANDKNKGYSFGTMPNAPTVAATFDKTIAKEFGRHIGNQSLWIGGPSIWAGGANLHRTPFGGRTHEYYSEDSVLSALTLTDFTQGGKDLGCILAPKHFAFNDYEYNRYGLAEFMTEQQARENDLRCFQGAFEDTKVLGVMTAFNRIGVTYLNAHTGLMQNILRKEWAFKGLISTDMVNNAYYFMLAETIMGGVTMMANSNTVNTATGGVWEYASAENIAKDAKLNAQLRKNMHYQWYAYANSNLMNGMNETSRIVSHMTWWRGLLIGGITAFSVLTAGAIALYIITSIKGKDDKKAKEVK